MVSHRKGISMTSVNYNKLMMQAPMTIDLYFDQCVKILKENDIYDPIHNTPELLGMMVQACAIDYGASCIAKNIEKSILKASDK